MSKDKQKYLAAYVPESVPKETPKRSGIKSDGRTKEIEDAIAAFNELLAKQSRDNLDAMYNIDMGNMSSSMRRLFQSYDDGITKSNASIESWANAQEAGFKAIAEWQGETTKSISSIEGKADANSASITLLTQWKGTASESISSLTQKADANAASITLLNQWKGTASSSIAAVQTLASQNGAKITSLTSWQNTVEDDLEGLSSSVAYIEELADENGASISQIVKAVGKNGEVNAASIVAAVNDAGSGVMLNADRINLDGDIYISGKNNSGDEAMRILGNKLQMLHFSGEDDSAASIAFWYDEFDSDLLGTLSTTRNTDNERDARYAVTLQTFDRGSYPVALKLKSNGASSLEADTSVYMRAGTYFNIHAEYGTRIYAAIPFSAAIEDYPLEEESYIFCSEGIYFVDWTGDVHLVVENP